MVSTVSARSTGGVGANVFDPLKPLRALILESSKPSMATGLDNLATIRGLNRVISSSYLTTTRVPGGRGSARLL